MTLQKSSIRDIPVLTCSHNDNTPKPLVFLAHGFRGNKEFWEDKLHQLAELGYYATAFDNRLHGERPGPNFNTTVFTDGLLNVYEIRKAINETTDDVKTLIDHFTGQPEILEDKIGMCGVSMGGYTTFKAVAIDKRITVAAPIIGSPYWNDVPRSVSVLQTSEALQQLEAYSNEHHPANTPDAFFPRALLIQNGDQDKHFDVGQVQRFHEMLKPYYQDDAEKLHFILHKNVAHEFTDAMWEHAVDWFQKYL